MDKIFQDRIPSKANRRKITFDGQAEPVYAVIELADEPLVEGTPITADSLNQKIKSYTLVRQLVRQH